MSDEELVAALNRLGYPYDPQLIAEVRRVAEQRAAEAACYAWEQGYDSCRSGEQRRNPYRAAALTATPNHGRSAT